MRYVFDIGLWYAPNDIEHHTFVIVDPDITEWEFALWVVIDWAMEIGRKLNRDKQSPDSWPSNTRRPKNITSFKLLEVS